MLYQVVYITHLLFIAEIITLLMHQLLERNVFTYSPYIYIYGSRIGSVPTLIVNGTAIQPKMAYFQSQSQHKHDERNKRKHQHFNKNVPGDVVSIFLAQICSCQV